MGGGVPLCVHLKRDLPAQLVCFGDFKAVGTRVVNTGPKDKVKIPVC